MAKVIIMPKPRPFILFILTFDFKPNHVANLLPNPPLPVVLKLVHSSVCSPLNMLMEYHMDIRERILIVVYTKWNVNDNICMFLLTNKPNF